MNDYLKGFKKYSNLLKELVKKGIKLKYRRSKLGILWTLLEPMFSTAVLAVVFGTLFERNAVTRVVDGKEIKVVFVVYILTGRLIYTYFSQATKQALRSIRRNSGMIKKVYVPKYLYPLSSILHTFVVFLISLIVLVAYMAVFKVSITWRIVEAIIPIVLLLLLAFGVGLIMSTGAVFFRDLEYLWDIALMVVMYASAIFYDAEERLAKMKHRTDITVRIFRAMLKYNPLYAIISMFRDTVIFQRSINTEQLIVATVAAVATSIFGLLLFHKKQDEFILHI